MHKLLAGFIGEICRRHLLPLPTENITPEDYVTPEDLPPNDCCTKSGRISKLPERLNL